MAERIPDEAVVVRGGRNHPTDRGAEPEPILAGSREYPLNVQKAFPWKIWRLRSLTVRLA
jgi:hypothetical protein